jgi:DNA repair protein RadD
VLELRQYQLDLIDQARSLMKQGCKSMAIVSPCGSGKTALIAHMLKTAASKGFRSIFLCHRRELIFQTMKAFDLEGIKYGIISAGFESQPALSVQIASVQTLARRLNQYGEPRLIVFDECHHIAAASWSAISRRFPHAYRLGITASPIRLDGKGLADHFHTLISGPAIQTLISQGYLSPYRLYAPMHISVEGVHTKMGDYVRSELEGVMDRPSITGDAVEHYRKFADGKRALVFCVSIQHSQHVAAQFQAAGIRAEHVDGETPADQRDDSMRRFRNGELQILTSVEIFGEGVDVPGIEAIVLLRPTQSLGLYLQQIGRGLRPAPGKREAILLDHVGNCERHGLPCEPHEWTLKGSLRRFKGSSSATSVRICGRCFAAQESGRPTCKFCGFTFEVKPREVREKDGELTEVNKELLRKQSRQTQGMAQSMEELYRIGVARGYKNPRAWSYFVFKARMAKRLGKVS